MSVVAAGSTDSAQQSPASLALSASLSAAPKKAVTFDEEVTVYIYPFHLNGPDADAVWGDKEVWEGELIMQGAEREGEYDEDCCEDDDGFEKFVDESGSGSGCRTSGAEEEEEEEEYAEDEEEYEDVSR
eukprot:Rhum_TRINITY_DN24420_c0_g1::Rhum_TRINITY_DN24420_c0_g1_i1::g.179755::m.179755